MGKRKNILQFWVLPQAKVTELIEFDLERSAWKLRVAAPPLENKANEEIIRWLSKQVGCPKASFSILSGEHHKSKKIAHECEFCNDGTLQELLKKIQKN